VAASREVTVAATQFACANDKPSNLDKAEAMVRRAVTEGAEFVLLRERFETPHFCKDQLPVHFALTQPEAGNGTLSRMAALATLDGAPLAAAGQGRSRLARQD